VRCRRSGKVCLTVALFACLVASAARAESQKLRVNDPQLTKELIGHGGKLVADYGGFQVVEMEASADTERAAKLQVTQDADVLELNATKLNTRSTFARSLRRPAGSFIGRKLHLIQFAGPIKPEWWTMLETAGARIISYIPNNAYLIYARAGALAKIQSWAAVTNSVQWEGEYANEFKLDPAARLTDANGLPQTPDSDLFAVQIVTDPSANSNTVALIEQWKREPIRREFRVLQYRNFIVRLPPERLPDIAAQPDVVSIQPYVDPQKRDERQDQIIAGNLTGALPSAPGYLSWLADKGFTQEQFDASGFVVDVTDSGIDNGTLAPGHFGLYRLGDPASASRVAYNRVIGTPHPESTAAGLDGHGNLNAHIVAGYNNYDGFPHADAAGFRFGLGVCPFVRIGASVVFDPDTFTSPDYADLQSRAYADGARISANSWGMSNNTYTVDAQAFDALVRDAQPDGSAFVSPGNQQMVILFAAGNQGATPNSVGAPGTAKNVITVGASENVRSLNSANGGSGSMGNDGCGFSDAIADGALDLAAFSSRGPCSDGRQKPDLVAPGSHVTGGVAQSATGTNGNGTALTGFKASSLCALKDSGIAGSEYNFFPLGQQFYTVSSGTSHAVPAVAGACALLRQYFLNHGLAAPSPAMTKAFLMNSTRYLTGAGANDPLWSPGQGMGELNLGRSFDGLARILRDQLAEDLFTASGQVRVYTGRISDLSQPVRITLAWTDAPGSTTGNAFNNDLDLTVTCGTNTYLGNNFSGKFSVPGGNPDARNNVESIFLPAGTSGDLVVTVTAANINSDGVPDFGTSLDQDFALVVYNVAATATPIISTGGSAVVAETYFPTNGVVDDGETVSVRVALQNTGTASTTNLMVTLLATNGVSAPNEAQNYGVLTTAGEVVNRVFTFTASGTCGSSLHPVLSLVDGTNSLGSLTLSLPLGLTTLQTTDFTNAAAITIPDSGPATLYPSTLNVSGLTGVVTRVTATLRGYSHSWPDDVDVLLVGPDGQKVLLMSDCGGGGEVNDLTLTFDDGALSPLLNTSASATGSYKPTNFDTVSDNFPSPAPGAPFGSTMSLFNGRNPNGNWSLYVQDDGSLDSGSITQGWILSITASNLVCASSAGNVADLGVAQTFNPVTAAVGSNVTVSINLTNQGPSPAAFVTLTNVLPASLSFLSASASSGIVSHTAGVVFDSLGLINPGETISLTIQTLATTAGVLTNQILAGAITFDPNLSNNVAFGYLAVNDPSSQVATQHVASVTNTAPLLLPIPDLIVHAGSLVLVTNIVTDTDATNALAFTLEPGAPPGATIDATSGLFAWLTSDAMVNTTNLIGVRVTDDGSPPLSDARSFLVTVVSRPLIAGIAVNNGQVFVAWNSLPGQMYRLEYTTNLLQGNWSAASSDLTATGAVTTQTNALTSAAWQFYRVRVLP